MFTCGKREFQTWEEAKEYIDKFNQRDKREAAGGGEVVYYFFYREWNIRLFIYRPRIPRFPMNFPLITGYIYFIYHRIDYFFSFLYVAFVPERSKIKLLPVFFIHSVLIDCY